MEFLEVTKFRPFVLMKLLPTNEASAADVLREYPQAVRVVCVSVGEVRKAGSIVANRIPPKGHVCIYRKDNPGKRIGGGAAGSMAKRAKLVP